MERKVTILSNKGANQKEFQTIATTLGELKADLDELGVEYDGMSFYEGISKTELMNDNSVLPSNLPYKGEVTNDLVILLTVKDKKITSGSLTPRQEIYARVKEFELQDDIQDYFGKNFTQVTTVELEEFISRVTAVKSECNDCEEEVTYVEPNTEAALRALMAELNNEGVLDDEPYEVILEILDDNVEEKPLISSQDYNDMFNFL